MNQSIYTGFSSSLANSKAMDVTADNIANINTTGYKSSSAEFATLFSTYLNTAGNNPVTSDDSHGVRVNGTALDMSAGSYQSSDSTFHMAVNGQGWFGVINDNIYNASDISYTRDGTFSQNSDGYLVNGNGYYLLGTDYGVITEGDDGNFVIDTSATAAVASSNVGDQSSLFAPKFLVYPHVTTSSSTLQRNLYSESSSQLTAAEADTNFEALLSPGGNLLEIENDQDVLVSVGTDNATYESGNIVYSFATLDDTLSLDAEASFTINGVPVTASWNDGDSAETIAAALSDAINTAGIDSVTASYDNNTITLTATENLVVTDSTYPSLTPLYVANVSYDATNSGDANTYATLGELADELETVINTVYGEGSAEVFINSSGAVEVAAKTATVEMNFQRASNTNLELLSMLNGLGQTIVEDTVSTSQAFSVASNTSSQTIIDENGDEQLLFVTMTQTAPKTAESGSVWEAEAKIVSRQNATELTDASELLSNGESVDLKTGQDMWLSIGNGSIQKTTFGYDYALEAPDDLPDGSDGSLSFTVNGTAVSVTIADGSSPAESADQIAAALQNLGIDASTNSGEVLIHADDATPTLTITGGSSSYDDYTIPSHTLQYAEYGTGGENSFTTFEDILAMIDTGSQNAGLSLSSGIDDGVLSVSNTGSEDIGFRVLSGVDSNTDFVNLINPTYDPITAGNTVSTTTLATYTVLDSTTQTLTFDTSAELAEGTSISLQNGTEELVLDLSNLTNYEEGLDNEYFTQNGESEGDFVSYDVDQNGKIIANFDNGESVAIAEVNLYHFQNEQGLQRVGDNQYIESANSGEAFFYLDEDGNVTNGGIIKNQTLETSNVSTASALSEMIVLQRAFEGAAKIISTSNELLQNAINMKK